MLNDPLEMYHQVGKSTLTGRELEAYALNKAASVLQDVRNTWNEADLTVRLDEALRYNQKLWTLLQVEIADAGNPLPKPIKENLLSLSMFIDKRTFEVMADPAAEKLDVLIDINRNIAAGLTTPSNTDAQGEASQPDK